MRGHYEYAGEVVEPAWGLLVFLRKETGHICEHIVRKSETRFQDIKWKKIVADGDTIPARPYALDPKCSKCRGTGKTPKRKLACSGCGGSGNEPGGPFIPVYPCGYCPARKHCWGKLEFAERNGKPRWAATEERTDG